MPSLQAFETLCLAVRDDIAKQVGDEPEQVRVIGVKVYFELGAKADKKGIYHAIGVRNRYDPTYAEILHDMT